MRIEAVALLDSKGTMSIVTTQQYTDRNFYALQPLIYLDTVDKLSEY